MLRSSSTPCGRSTTSPKPTAPPGSSPAATVGPTRSRRPTPTRWQPRCRPGRCCSTSGSLWHGGGANHTDRAPAGRGHRVRRVVGAPTGKPHAGRAAGDGARPSRSASRSSSATTSGHRSSATSTAATPFGPCDTPRPSVDFGRDQLASSHYDRYGTCGDPPVQRGGAHRMRGGERR